MEYLQSICVDPPEILCTCAEENGPPINPPIIPPTKAPGEKPTSLYTCSRRPIILYLLWIEDDFGLRNHKNSHKMGEFSGYFLQRLHEQLDTSTELFKNYTINVRSIRKDKTKYNKYGNGVIIFFSSLRAHSKEYYSPAQVRP